MVIELLLTVFLRSEESNMAKKSDSAAGKLITVSVLGLSGKIYLLNYKIRNS